MCKKPQGNQGDLVISSALEEDESLGSALQEGETFSLLVPEAFSGQRLDRALLALCHQIGEADEGTHPLRTLSRARLQALIKQACVSCQGQALTDPSVKIRGGAVYDLLLPPPEPAAPEPQSLPLVIPFEDEHLLVVNKPAGLVVHPAAGNRDHTLVNALLAYCGASLSGIGGVARPGIVHRLDKDTSGLMVVAKHDAAHQALAAQFADRSLGRCYQALVWGVPVPPAGSIEGAIARHPRDRKKMAVVGHGGRAALTHYKVLEPFGDAVALVACRLATGRTHQIRVHMAHKGHPLVGDTLYGRGRIGRLKGFSEEQKTALLQFGRQALHAYEIHFLHPITGEKMTFEAPLPPDLERLLSVLRKGRT